jgi:hypothetical protein
MLPYGLLTAILGETEALRLLRQELASNEGDDQMNRKKVEKAIDTCWVGLTLL